MEVEAFQTLDDRKNPKHVEKCGPFQCNRRNAWLGTGFYFWDSIVKWAHDWGNRNYGGNYIICEGKILIDQNCFDLVGNLSHQQEFVEIIKTMKTSSHFSNKNNVTVGKAIEFMKRRGIFNYSTIRAQDQKDGYKVYFKQEGPEFITLVKRTQICLVNKSNLISRSVKVVHPVKYLK